MVWKQKIKDEDILLLLKKENKPMTIYSIAKKLKVNYFTAQRRIQRLLKEGKVKPKFDVDYGRFKVVFYEVAGGRKKSS